MKSHPFELLKAFHIASALAEFIEEVFTPSFTALLFASMLCTLLIGVRMSLHHSIALGFLLWNLFLAWLPFLISRYISFKNRYDKKFAWPLLPLWLAFLPNAPYLLTDFVHLHLDSPTFWLDILILFSSAVVGLALGIASLLKVHDILLKEFGKNLSRALIAAVLPLCSFGIFMGRELRWNSWDILTRPATLLRDISTLFGEHQIAGMLEFTTVFTIFLAAAYGITRKFCQTSERVLVFKKPD